MRAVGGVLFVVAVRVAVAVVGIGCVAFSFGACIDAAVVVCTGVVAAVITIVVALIFVGAVVVFVSVVVGRSIPSGVSGGRGTERIDELDQLVMVQLGWKVFGGSWVVVGRFAVNSAWCFGQ